MIRRILGLILSFGLLGAAVVAVTSLDPEVLPRVTRVVPQVDVKAVCLHLDQAGTAYVAGADQVADLGGQPAATGEPTVVDDQEAHVVATGSRAITGGFLDQEENAAVFTPCGPAVSEAHIVVPNTDRTDLLVVNSDSSDASVDLTLWGPEGEITVVGARGIDVAPDSERVVALSVLADVEGPVGVRVATSRGRVTAIARTSSGPVTETASMSQAGQEHHLAGIPAGATTATLLITNPGNERIDVAVEAQGATARYVPAGAQAVSVPAHSTVAVELGPVLAGEATGLTLTSEADFVAGASVGGDADRAQLQPSPASHALAAHGPPGGVLQLSNPGTSDAGVRVGGQEITVPAGLTHTLQLGDDASLVEVESSTPIHGAVTHVGEAGTFVVPLTDNSDLAVAPIDAELNPGLR